MDSLWPTGPLRSSPNDAASWFRGDRLSPVLQNLAEDTQEIVNLGVLRHYSVFYLEKFEPEVPETILTVRVGQRAPLYCSALGKILLASLPEYELDTYLKTRDFPAQTSQTITTRETLEAEIGQVRAQGWAIDREEFVEGILCFAAPVVFDGQTLAAISITVCRQRARRRFGPKKYKLRS